MDNINLLSCIDFDGYDKKDKDIFSEFEALKKEYNINVKYVKINNFIQNIKEVDTKDIDILIIPLIILENNQDLLNDFTNLKWIINPFTGINSKNGSPSILQKIKEKNIIATSTKISGLAIAEMIIAYILNSAKNLFSYKESQVKKIYKNTDIDQSLIFNKKVLILGTGEIGCNTARILNLGFNCLVDGINTKGTKIKYFNEIFIADKLKDIIYNYDYIISTLPYTDKTKNIINKEILALIKKTAVFINVGRGGTVDEEELISRLENDKLAYAYLDVAIQEPTLADNPIWNTKNLLYTAHQADFAIQDNKINNVMKVFLYNFKFFQKGKLNNMKYVVNEKEY